MANKAFVCLLVLATIAATALAAGKVHKGSTCGGIKQAYRGSSCCGQSTSNATHFQVVPAQNIAAGTNVCAGKKPSAAYFNNENCTDVKGVRQVLEQAGANITKGYKGQINATSRQPIVGPYYKHGLCPVNVHWHQGTEHYSLDQYDERGSGPTFTPKERRGFRCHHYNKADTKFTTPYKWEHCLDMQVGETYEVHWPHSKAGACGTPNQYQTPFYDGVFCTDGIITLSPLNVHRTVGVQGQVFTIVNDEKYFYPDLFRGMIVDGAYGQDIATYTGSTTGTSRNNQICSKYTPITWQVDRKCHLISASSFDKMCADMKQQRDDMSSDLHPHGSRTLVADFLAADNLQRRKFFQTEPVNLWEDAAGKE
jgi:hypothetical protein